MFRVTLRTFACALTTAALAAPASAATGDTPTIWNATTGAQSVYGGPDRTTVGDTLRGSDSDWAGIGVYDYQWHRCADSQGQVCSALPGATTTQYTTVADDYGMTLKFCATVPRGSTSCSTPSSIVFAKHDDTDGDGTPNYKDKCPATAAATADGCPAPAPGGDDRGHGARPGDHDVDRADSRVAGRRARWPGTERRGRVANGNAHSADRRAQPLDDDRLRQAGHRQTGRSSARTAGRSQARSWRCWSAAWRHQLSSPRSRRS